MDKNMEEKIIAVANYIVDNKATIIQTAEHFNMSPSSIKKYINSKERLSRLEDMYAKHRVQNSKEENIKNVK